MKDIFRSHTNVNDRQTRRTEKNVQQQQQQHTFQKLKKVLSWTNTFLFLFWLCSACNRNEAKDLYFWTEIGRCTVCMCWFMKMNWLLFEESFTVKSFLFKNRKEKISCCCDLLPNSQPTRMTHHTFLSFNSIFTKLFNLHSSYYICNSKLKSNFSSSPWHIQKLCFISLISCHNRLMILTN